MIIVIFKHTLCNASFLMSKKMKKKVLLIIIDYKMNEILLHSEMFL